MPDCRMDLFMDADEADNPALVGEEYHIVATDPGGPRGDSPLTSEQRDMNTNFILMYCNHHAAVDGATDVYPVERLNPVTLGQRGLWPRAS